MNETESSSAPGTHHLSDNDNHPPGFAVSLGNEFDTLRAAIHAALLIADAVRHGESSSDADAALAPHAISAVLSLVECRLRLVVQTVTAQVEPVRLAARHNQVTASAFGIQGEDILIQLGADKPISTAPRAPRQTKARVDDLPDADDNQ